MACLPYRPRLFLIYPFHQSNKHLATRANVGRHVANKTVE